MRILSVLIACGLVLLALPRDGHASETRLISGEIMVIERLALPEETVIIVDLSGGDDTWIADKRLPTEGRQSPLPFAIEAPQDIDMVLRVGLRAHEEMFWLSEPAWIREGDSDVALGPIRVMRLPQMGASALLSCGNTLLEVGILPDGMRLRINEQIIWLEAQPAASGALYVDPANAATSVHSKGDMALVRIDGAELAECTAYRPELDLTAGVWNISAIDDKPTLFPSRTELVFFPDGRVSATVGCNRMIGSYSRHGNILSFGRIAMTRMACPEGLDAQEAQFTAALIQIDGMRLDASAARLSLLSGGKVVVQARK